jgi:hypothetical protein
VPRDQEAQTCLLHQVNIWAGLGLPSRLLHRSGPLRSHKCARERHPIEELPPKLHGGLVVEADEIRYRASEILSLYHRPDYPFARRS